jgi:hypothetical protein
MVGLPQLQASSRSEAGLNETELLAELLEIRPRYRQEENFPGRAMCVANANPGFILWIMQMSTRTRIGTVLLLSNLVATYPTPGGADLAARVEKS